MTGTVGDREQHPGIEDEEPDATDRGAVLAVRAGNVNGFGTLVQRYQRRLFNLCRMLVRNPHHAEELAQEAFLRAYQKLERYDVGRPFYPWLATIAVRLAQTALRRKQIEVVADEQDALASEDHTPFDDVVETESQNLWNLVAGLPAGERIAVVLVYRQECSLAEAASIVGVTTGTIKTLLFRARKHLRVALNDREEAVQ